MPKFALVCNTEITYCLIRFTFILFILLSVYQAGAQHIQYRDKKKPVAQKTDAPAIEKVIPVPDKTVKIIPADTLPKPVSVNTGKIIPVDTLLKPVASLEDTSAAFIKSRAAFTMNPRPKKPYVEEQNICNLVSRPELAPQLPLVINNVKPEMLSLIKERYKGRLYSITGLNMIDERLKFKLKICDKDNAKFRSEYLDKDGNIVNDPDLDYD